jgi:hypothetical protein
LYTCKITPTWRAEKINRRVHSGGNKK